MRESSPREPAGRLCTAGITRRPDSLEILFEGRPVVAFEGETVAAALIASGVRRFRTTERGEPRGLFCGMGTCFDCLVRIDGRGAQRACLTKVAPGMSVQGESMAAGPAAEARLPLADAPDGALPVDDDEVLVIGAGPGGLCAAEAAAGVGATVTVLDERPEPGGQFFKQLAPSHTFARAAAMDRQYAGGRSLIERVRAVGVRVLSQSTVWGAFPHDGDGIELGVLREGRAVRHRARQLIVATGAYERAWPVPGWTLPGVMTTGAVQTLLRAYRVAPGSRVLLAGNGPLNLQVARELVQSGVQVVAVAEAASRPGLARGAGALLALARSPDLVADGVLYLAQLARRRVPVLFGHVLVRVEGEHVAERAVLARIDRAGRPVPGSERRFEVDTVCLGYGFAASNELPRLLGCRHSHRERPWPGLAVERDEHGATSRAGVFVVGDCGAIGGARVAQAQGALAGLEAARRLGHSGDARVAKRRAAARRALARGLAFQRALWELFGAPPLDSLVSDAAIVCRCEGVTAASVRRLVAAGGDEMGVVKRMTRAGMGRCQGRYCAATLARACAGAPPGKLDEWAFFAPRFPLKPVPAVALASRQPEWHEQDQGVEAPAPAEVRHLDPGECSADVAIIGAGIIGSCTAYYLAREGVDVVVLERGRCNGEASGNNAGSLHVQLLAYDFGDWAQAGGRAAAETLPLQRESAALWPAFARELGVDLDLDITGGLMLAEDAARLEHLREKARLERRYGVEVEILSAPELRELAPYVSADLAGAAWCPAEGKINPMLAGPAVIEGARAAGARVHEDTGVRSIERTGSGFALRTARGTFRAGRVLNASGGWSARVAAMAGTHLPIRANPIQLIVTEPAPPLAPHLLAYADRHLTLKQVRNGNLVIGGGWRAALDAHTHRATVLRESFEGNLWVAARVLPALATLHVIRSWAALNVAVDGAPLLGEVPGLPGFYNAVTVNGITLGPLIGRLSAQMLRTGKTLPALDFFTLSRFG